MQSSAHEPRVLQPISRFELDAPNRRERCASCRHQFQPEVLVFREVMTGHPVHITCVAIAEVRP